VGDVIVTNAHVVAGASELSVIDSAGITRAAIVTGFDPSADLAALKVMGAPVSSRAAQFADAEAGDRGSVAGSSYEVKRRIRAKIGDIYGEQEVVRPSLELAAEISDGDSGAPLINDQGVVVGVIYANSRGKAATAYAIRAPEVEEFLAGVSGAPVEPGDCR
jgi:S1-C subfamily serine protease